MAFLRFGMTLYLALCVADVHGIRVTRQLSSHPVELLLTRHGVSCANLVKYWPSSKNRLPHRIMKDPMLCEAGKKLSASFKPEIAQKIKNLTKDPWTDKPDAILSSVLVRAIETAINMYGHPVHVVPYIRETGGFAGVESKDNQFKTPEVQVERLSKRYASSFSVNYQYAQEFGFKPEGDWKKFMYFLEKSFLPDLIRSKNKQSGEPIVLAIVTHSNFMNEGEVSRACSKVWTSNHGAKANNNEVVRLSFQYEIDVNPSSDNITPQTSLVPQQTPLTCNSVIKGVSVYANGTEKMQPLCRSDIGDACWNEIQRSADEAYPKTVERKIRKLTEEAEDVRQRANKESKHGHFSKASKTYGDMMAIEARRDELKQVNCWAGGKPAEL